MKKFEHELDDSWEFLAYKKYGTHNYIKKTIDGMQYRLAVYTKGNKKITVLSPIIWDEEQFEHQRDAAIRDDWVNPIVDPPDVVNEYLKK